ncbi:alpha/beta fold hydrolase [Actinomycetaceae bacterium L2_0104]
MITDHLFRFRRGRSIVLAACLALSIAVAGCANEDQREGGSQTTAPSIAPSETTDTTTVIAPHPALPDGAEEIDVAVGEYELPGKLTMPGADAEGPNVVVLFVAGSGPSDMDETIGAAGNAPLRDLAYQLADEGVPSLRYDKRYHAAPESYSDSDTIDDEVLDDVSAALQMLETHPDTAGRQIIVVGHSLGGMLIPAIAAQHPEVAGAAILAGTPRTLWEVIRDQNQAQVDAMDIDPEQAEQMMAQVNEEVDRANELSDPEAEPVLGSLPAPYVVSLNELDLAETARTLDIPLLVMQGEADIQTSATVDFEAWQDVLADVPDVTYQLFPDLNHLFMKTAGVEGIADYDPENAVDPEVSKTIDSWLNERW